MERLAEAASPEWKVEAGREMRLNIPFMILVMPYLALRRFLD